MDLRVELLEGSIVDQILKRAAELDADLIVMGTEGLGGVKRLLLGSVTTTALHRASCPVMTVGPPAEDRRPDEPVAFSGLSVATNEFVVVH